MAGFQCIRKVFANDGIAYITKRGAKFSQISVNRLNSTIESDTLLRFWYTFNFLRAARNS
jgi:hypothetical protein